MLVGVTTDKAKQQPLPPLECLVNQHILGLPNMSMEHIKVQHMRPVPVSVHQHQQTWWQLLEQLFIQTSCSTTSCYAGAMQPHVSLQAIAATRSRPQWLQRVPEQPQVAEAQQAEEQPEAQQPKRAARTAAGVSESATAGTATSTGTAAVKVSVRHSKHLLQGTTAAAAAQQLEEQPEDQQHEQHLEQQQQLE